MGKTPPARGEVRCERQTDETLLVHVVGHWTTRAGAPVVTEVYQRLDASPPVRRLAATVGDSDRQAGCEGGLRG